MLVSHILFLFFFFSQFIYEHVSFYFQVSSDNDEPIFFHQNLKLSSLNAAFDDDKDLDTSLSQGDAPMLNLGMSIRGEEGATADNSTNQKPPSEKENKTIGNGSRHEANADPYNTALGEEYGSSFDNDLAALMMQVKFPSTDDVISWQQISLNRREEEEEMYRREEEDLQRHIEQHQSNTAHIGVGPDYDDDEMNEYDPEVDMEQINLQVSSSSQTSSDIYQTGAVDSSTSPELSLTEKSFQARLHQGIMKDLSSLGPQERKQLMREQSRTKDQEIVSSLNSDQQTMLNFRLFEELDLGM